MYEARNSVDIAKSKGAEKYAPDVFSKATGSLQMAENALASKVDKSKVITHARQTIQVAEDARAPFSGTSRNQRIRKTAMPAAAAAREQAETQAAADEASTGQPRREATRRLRRKSGGRIGGQGGRLILKPRQPGAG